MEWTDMKYSNRGLAWSLTPPLNHSTSSRDKRAKCEGSVTYDRDSFTHFDTHTTLH